VTDDRVSFFRLLGPMSVHLHGTSSTLTPPKQRTVLALLLAHRGHTVNRAQFVDELWGEHPPASAGALIQTYVHKLRRQLEVDPEVRVETRHGGYLLDLGGAELDVATFVTLSAQARGALAAGDDAVAAETCGRALALWRGSVLDGVVGGPLLGAYATWLEEEHLLAIDTHVEAGLRLGHHDVLVAELSRLSITYPLRESFTAALIVALQRCGRRAEALSVYRRLHERMVDELGAVPSTRMRRLHESLLGDDPGTDQPPATPLRPAQLPPGVADFVGRATEVTGLQRALAQPTPVISIVGMAGVGKTALALHVAHRLRDRFPDGQLHARLGSTGPAPVLHRFLRSCVGVDDVEGDDIDELAGLFRSWSAGRNVLVVLDDAQSASQVQPLLPGGPGCAVVMTSRTGVPGTGATATVELPPLDPDDARRLLVSEAGTAADRFGPGDIDTIVEVCERLPLAVRAAASRLLAMPDVPVRQLVAELTDCRGNLLDQLAWGEFDVRSALAAGCRALDAAQRRALAAVGVLAASAAGRRTWPVFTASELAAETGAELRTTVAALDGLARHRLVRRAAAGAAGTPSYRVGRLVACFAAELRAVPSPADDPAVP